MEKATECSSCLMKIAEFALTFHDGDLSTLARELVLPLKVIDIRCYVPCYYHVCLQLWGSTYVLQGHYCGREALSLLFCLLDLFLVCRML